MIVEMSSAAMDALLENEMVAHLGCHAEDTTYVVPIHYAYDEGRIYGHTVVGKKISMMRQNPLVCIEICRIHNLFEWESVIAWGNFRELEEEEAAHALQVFMLKVRRRAAVHDEVGPMTLEGTVLRRPYIQGREPVIYAIDITHKTGRAEIR